MDINKIRLEDKARDFNWINSLFEDGNLFVNGKKFTASTFEKFRLLVKSTQEVYEDSWDIEIVKNGETGINIKGIVILFKDIIIKNSRDKEHSIKDLFVKIELDIYNNNLIVRDLCGGRTTLTYSEWSVGYMHSHLPHGSISSGSTPPFWGNFCRGSGHINDFIAEINSRGGFKEENLTPFLIQILGLVSWESLEGVPHKKLEFITPRPSSGRVFAFSKAVIDAIKRNILAHYKAHKTPPDIDFKLESGGYTIVDNEKLDKYVLESIPLPDQDKSYLISMPAANGTHYAFGHLPGFRTPPNNTNKYIFQGQEVSVIVGDPPSLGDMDESNYTLNPRVKEYIKQDLEYVVNTKKIRKSTIDRYSSENGNASKGVEPNKMALQGNS